MAKDLFKIVYESTKQYLEQYFEHLDFKEVQPSFHTIHKDFRSEKDPFVIEFRDNMDTSSVDLVLKLNQQEVFFDDFGKPDNEIASGYLTMLKKAVNGNPIIIRAVTPLKDIIEIRYKIKY